MSNRRLSGHSAMSSRPSSGKADAVETQNQARPASRKSTSAVNNEDSVILECRAAYVSVVKGSSTNNPLTSKAQLLLALQNAGRNPTQRSLGKSWSKSTESVTFEEFCEICKHEPLTSADDLMKAFKKIDINGDGFISHSELKKIMTTRGEKMSDEEVSRLIDEVDENRDGKLDYKEFSNMVLNTSKKCKETAIRRFEKRKTPKDTLQESENTGGNTHKSSVNGQIDDSMDSGRQRGHHSPLRENNSTVRDQKGASSVRERRNSSNDKSDTKRAVPRSPRMSPRQSKGAKSKDDDSQKDKFGSQTSLRSVDSRHDLTSSLTLNLPPKPPPSSTSLKNANNKLSSNRVALAGSEDDDNDVIVTSPTKPSLRAVSEGSLRSVNDGTVSPHSPVPKPRLSSTERRVPDPAQEDSPKPAPRRMSRQEAVKPAISSLQLKLNTPNKYTEWRKMSRRGMFYVEDNGELTSTQYLLSVGKATRVWLSICPSPCPSTATPATPLDMCVFIVRSKPDKNGAVLVDLTEERDAEGTFAVGCDLDPGKYVLVTFTSGCGFPLARSSTETKKKLVRKKTNADGEDQFTLTKEFKYTLTDIFNLMDVDMNGLLSREEFNMYSVRTGEDTVGDDEWEIVKENAELKQGELTCKGFIQLIELEADDAAGDTDDLWLALESLGYDSSLVQNQAYPFTIEVGVESDPTATLTIQSGLVTPKSRSLQLATKEAYMGKGELLSRDQRCRSAKSSGNDKDVKIYCYETEFMAAVLVDNKLPSRVTVHLDCSASKNIKSNRNSLVEVFAVPANTAKAVCHLLPKDESKEWLVSCIEKELLTSK